MGKWFNHFLMGTNFHMKKALVASTAGRDTAVNEIESNKASEPTSNIHTNGAVAAEPQPDSPVGDKQADEQQRTRRATPVRNGKARDPKGKVSRHRGKVEPRLRVQAKVGRSKEGASDENRGAGEILES
jgi:hypothetical protein